MFHTIREIVVHAAEHYGKEDAVRYKAGKDVIESKSYDQLKADSERISNMLESLGELGHHIAIIGPTSYEWLISFLGTVNSGSVAVPVDVSLPTADVCDLLNRADVTALIYDPIRQDVADQIKTQCPGISSLICMKEIDGAEQKDIKGLPSLLAEQSQQHLTNPDPDSLCTIMFTSGTTGKSKGVMLTHRNLAENATCLDMKLPPRTVLLTVLPVHHAYCLSMDILKGISLGSVICINDSIMRLAKNIKLFMPNIILMVPLMIETLAKKLEAVENLPAEAVKKEIFGEQLHTIYSGGAYLNPALMKVFERYGIALLQGYGMTECSPVISTNIIWKHKADSVGALMPNCEARVEAGELLVRGSSVMQGYYKMPEETREALTEDGWLRTGDLGYVDEDQFLYLTGRKKNLIITSNGENVSPEEIENYIGEARIVQEILVRETEGVIEAEIFPDYEYTERKNITDIQAELQKIIDAYNNQVPAYKRVYRLKIRNQEFEKTPSKKIKR